MKYLSVILFGAALLMQVGCNSQTKTSEQVEQTSQAVIVNHSVQEFKEGVQGDVEILDVRTPEEYAGGHLPNAVNADVYGDDFANYLNSLDKSKTYYVYCHAGGRSMQACEQMIAMGFTNVHNMEGGIRDWNKANYELEK